jgi:hypothetical protein
MYELALRILLRQLDGIRSSLHSSLRRWEYVVVAGIALEAVVIGKEYWDAWRNHSRETIRSPEKPSTFLFVIGILGVVMVAGGITKQLSVDSNIEAAETQIREGNNLLFEFVSQEAGDASASAQIAWDAAKAAQGEAGQATASANLAKAKASAANTLASSAESEAGNARNEVTKAKEETAQLRKQALATETELKQEHGRRIELERGLARRELWNIGYKDGTTNLDKLKQFPGTKVILEAVPDFEAKHAAGEIAARLIDARWDIVRTDIIPDEEASSVPEGVSVERYLALHVPHEQSTEEDQSERRSSYLVMILQAFLMENGWHEINFGFPHRGELPIDCMRVRVGYKPNPLAEYDETTKKAHEKMNKIMIETYGNPNVNKPIAVWYGGARIFPFPPSPK